MLMSLEDLTAKNNKPRGNYPSPLFPLVVNKLLFDRGGKRIINNLSVQIEDVPCTAIIGANGAGKSVFLRLLHGLLIPTAGTIVWGTVNATEQHQSQAMVFQKPVLLKRSVEANLRYVLKRQRLSGDALERATSKYLRLADLSEAANRPAHVLSGGEAQRLAIARALATEPDILLLDEPTASLDPKARSSIESLLKTTMVNGVRVLIVTQDIGQAARLANEVVMMHNGHVVEKGRASDVLNNPQTEHARDFLDHKI